MLKFPNSPLKVNKYAIMSATKEPELISSRRNHVKKELHVNLTLNAFQSFY